MTVYDEILVNDHIPLSFWALLFFVVCVLLSSIGGVCLVLKASRNRPNRSERHLLCQRSPPRYSGASRRCRR
jgi:hypothetical protein